MPTFEELTAAGATPGPGAAPGFEVRGSPVAGPDPGALAAVGRGVAQGASLGFADEIGGAIGSLLSGQSYQQVRDEIRTGDKEAEAAHPLLYGAGQFGGGVASSFVPGLNVAKGATAAQAALSLGAQGAAAGIGASEATNTGQLLTDAAVGGGVGAVAGGLLHHVTNRILENAPRRVVDETVADAMSGSRAKDAKILSRSLNHDDVEREAEDLFLGKRAAGEADYKPVAEAIRKAQASGEPEAIQDALAKSKDYVGRLEESAAPAWERLDDAIKTAKPEPKTMKLSAGSESAESLNERVVGMREQLDAYESSGNPLLEKKIPGLRNELKAAEGELKAGAATGTAEVAGKAPSGGFRPGNVIDDIDDAIQRGGSQFGDSNEGRVLQHMRESLESKWSTASGADAAATVSAVNSESPQLKALAKALAGEGDAQLTPSRVRQIAEEVAGQSAEGSGYVKLPTDVRDAIKKVSYSFDADATLPGQDLRKALTNAQNNAVAALGTIAETEHARLKALPQMVLARSMDDFLAQAAKSSPEAAKAAEDILTHNRRMHLALSFQEGLAQKLDKAQAGKIGIGQRLGKQGADAAKAGGVIASLATGNPLPAVAGFALPAAAKAARGAVRMTDQQLARLVYAEKTGTITKAEAAVLQAIRGGGEGASRDFSESAAQ